MHPATQEDLRLFINWLAGHGMPTVDTYGWLVRCEDWVRSHIEEDKNSIEWIIPFPKGDTNASERSNSSTV